MEEIWKPSPIFGDRYEVSSLGRVRSIGNNNACKRGIMNPMCDRDGYLHVALYRDNSKKDISIHRLVALAFIPNPNNYKYVNHINKNTKDNRIENLEWCTNSYNLAYSIGKKVIQYSKDGKKISEFFCIADASRALGIPVANISKCCKGKRKIAGGFVWKYKEND